MQIDKGFLALSLTGVLVLSGGCATNNAVDKKIMEAQTRTDQKMETVEGQIEDIQEKQKATDEQIARLSTEAADALKRANEAGILAKGQVVFEESFTEDRVKFKTGSAKLGDQAQTALDEFADKVKALDKVVFIEIQGHTDSSGGTEYNEELGQDRAESVRRYLSRQHKLPLGRMSTISYGETLPAASNKTRNGRNQNRRVVLIVLE